MSDEDPKVVGGRRARGARRKLTQQNTEDVEAGEIAVGDVVVHPNFRHPISVVGKSNFGGLVSLDAKHDNDPVNWQIAETATIRRVLPEPEEAEG
jgi:hypothetical protein